ncbi:MAG: hypothetical protein IKK75_14105, partial [Clostridia bacterium]|nr:hypothetical protein [Clostridia bacterium]
MSKRTRKVLSVLMTLMMLFAQFPQTAHSHSHAHAEAAAELIRGTFQYAGMYNSRYDSTLDYAYTDAYFEGDAREYNPSLSTMSLCLEMSSWSSLDEEQWVDKSANARELLTEIGFVDFAQNDFWNDVPTLDSIGAVAAHKQLGDATLIALAVRGGGYYSEWGSNVLLGDSSDHDGFAVARDNVLAFLTQYIEDCGITGRVKLWLVGFSRGGAVANMTAGYLNHHALTADTTLVPADLYCYTVEAPQGVLDEDAGPDSDHRNIHNIINPNDIVPLVAPVNWGFSRYNQTSHLLPTITTTHYAEAREQMLKHYADILEGVDVLDPEKAAYNIPEYAKTLQMQVNWLNFLPGGEPFIEIETVDNTHLPQAIMLAESVSALVEAAESRDSFHESIEADISVLLGEMLGASKGTSLSEYIAELGRILTENNYQKLIHVLEPVVQLNLTPMEERIEAVGQRLREIIPQPEGYTDIVGTVGALADVLANMFVENPQALLNMALSLSSTSMIQAHYAEVTMAWLRTEDPNYSEQPFAYDVPESLRIVRVNCPVSLKVYDADGTVVASIIDGECSATIEGIGCAVNPDGEMVLYLPADAAFRVEIIANDNGSVSCSINEFNIVRSKHTFVISYADLPISTNDSLTAVLPAIEADEYTDEPRTGSTANYHLLGNDGAPIEPTLTLRGEEVLLHTVKAERNNEYGQVLGGGVYVHDSFAQLEAYPVSGGSFNGWYVDNQPVSTDPVYRFPVEGDITVVAHFGVATPSQITFRATEGGTVHNINNAYTPGSQVLLSATADEEYDFDEWTITAGDFMIAGDDLYYIVPETDATVTAKFVIKRFPCPNCEAMLPVGSSHTAPCGTEGHFTCAEDYAAENHAVCEHCSALLCDGSNHAFCTICGDGYVCEGGHGYGSGECGVYVCEACGVEILNTETHVAPCRTAGHFTCSAEYDAADHAACEHCSALLCDGNDRGICSICNDGHVC